MAISRTEPLRQLKLDPRDEQQLLEAAKIRVWEASGRTINDFSPSSPISALLEGQVFAQSELLYWLNSLPDAFVIAFFKRLGIERQIGTQAQCQLNYRLTTTLAQQFILPQGYSVFTEDGLEWKTNQNSTVSPGNILGQVGVTCQTVGSQGNIGPGLIKRLSVPLSYLASCTNDQAYGGLDAESDKDFYYRAFNGLAIHAPITAYDYEVLIKNQIGQNAIVRVEGSFGKLNCSVLDGQFEPLNIGQIGPLREWLLSLAPIGTEIAIGNFTVTPIDAELIVRYAPYDSKTTLELGTLSAKAMSEALKGQFGSIAPREIEWQLKQLPWIDSVQLVLIGPLGAVGCDGQIPLGTSVSRGRGLTIKNGAEVTSYDIA